ncbi:hypothetical protein RRG08_034110 [Elysia crispata]|uniref:Uncharacterized protein n=1 Tax=Elysia crispata TaxID=231223 RepID=A0AAE1DM70_9GAST|nr:hypothetical protein RRG08_034110 [Elysia crispata]
MGQRHLKFWVVLLQVVLICGLVISFHERSRRDEDGDDDDDDDNDNEDFGEGVVEQYILAREEAEYELEDFYKTAPPGMAPDVNSDAMLELRAARELLMKMKMPPKELADLLEGDPGLGIQDASDT